MKKGSDLYKSTTTKMLRVNVPMDKNIEMSLIKEGWKGWKLYAGTGTITNMFRYLC